MRQLQTQEIKSVSGAGLLTSVLVTGAQAGSAIGGGLLSLGKGTLQAGAIVTQPVVNTTVFLLKGLI